MPTFLSFRGQATNDAIITWPRVDYWSHRVNFIYHTGESMVQKVRPGCENQYNFAVFFDAREQHYLPDQVLTNYQPLLMLIYSYLTFQLTNQLSHNKSVNVHSYNLTHSHAYTYIVQNLWLIYFTPVEAKAITYPSSKVECKNSLRHTLPVSTIIIMWF